MSDYNAPVKDMLFAMQHLAGLDDIAALPGFEEASDDLVEAIVDEAARFTGEVLAPLNTAGDLQGSRIEGDQVYAPEGFKEAYGQFVESGWASLAGDPEYAGQGLPELVACPVNEMISAANLSFGLCPMLSIGALNALRAHAGGEILQACAEKMTSGEWTGSMNLTESQAGSDLSVVRTKAAPNGDHYLITGQKIFITWGDHDMAENIIHLVLARLPDAPEGIRGISLFAVPKYNVNQDGSLGELNDAKAVSLEHKMGIHASATCSMSFGDNGGAVGYLIGEEHKGLAHMFTMMNHERIGVGMQGLGVSDRAYQAAAAYAKERVQGGKTIINHADVRRMLMLMRASCEAMRGLIYSTNAHIDNVHKNPDRDAAKASNARIDLMTPVVKGWCTEMANEVTSLGIQVHGGMGFIEETGVAQYYRDARILAIYEGTNGIQAMDLIGRKLIRDGGTGYNHLISDMEETLVQLQAAGDALAAITHRFAQAVTNIKDAVSWVLANPDGDTPNSAAFNLLMLTGYVSGGWQMARAAVVANNRLNTSEGDDSFHKNKIITAGFYADHLLPRAIGHLEIIKAGSTNIMDLAEGDF